ncbi:hypothetical protein DVA67_008310 [Solirubrobacter sp. CPCC 204708]|uniref:DUF721 domain-containing protein n=1 Tax=Solirubrobacter deserti TaxID=2282478 RepID=A0ABT4RDW2_9ACTN|nr:hypothetical protein [Solirubrobacter deserti]MBE2315974.1 hypothetical protein [Solirubrobacter deserti]MDA0136725.1 hypothetical protein [Solirubrobacter deserti]
MSVADKAKDALSKVRSGPLEASRTLPIRASKDEIEQVWTSRTTTIFDGIPMESATTQYGQTVRDWGLAVTVHLRLKEAVPDMAANTLAGKAVRRLKALVETGEVPTTENNPSAREDAA